MEVTVLPFEKSNFEEQEEFDNFGTERLRTPGNWEYDQSKRQDSTLVSETFSAFEALLLCMVCTDETGILI